MPTRNLIVFTLVFLLILHGCGKKDTPPPPPPVAPNCSINTAPTNGAIVTSTNITLTWNIVSGATSYDVYIGMGPSQINFIQNVTTNSYNYTISTTSSTTYFWYVIPKNATGLAVGCSSSNTSFTYNPPLQVPSCTPSQSPINGTIITTNSITLSWMPQSNANTYDLYLGTNLNSIPLFASDISATSFNYTVSSTPTSTTYFWYVVPKNSVGPAIGCSNNINYFTYAVIQAPAPFGYYVVGYLPSYRNINDIPDVKFRMTNVVVYAFYGVNTSGTLTAPSAPAATLAATATKARANNAKIFLGINDGSGDGKTNFKNMAATPTGRNNFIKDVMNTVRNNNLDGVDMDWEFPSTSDGTDATFTLLMKELSDSLHRDARFYLSCAITAGKYAGGIRDAVRNEIFPYVDFFNVMAYDDFNTTVPYRQHSDYALAQTCLNYWLTTRGMPATKCVLGVPAYGRPSGITQSGTVLTYKTILLQGGSPQSDSAIVTAGGFTNYTIYYNGQYTVKRKAKLAKDIANGIMMWEKWQDAADGNSLLKAACDTVGRAY